MPHVRWRLCVALCAVSSHPCRVMLSRTRASFEIVTKHMKEILFFFLMAVMWQERAPAADIYVSPAGRDSNSGAKDRPLASLVRCATGGTQPEIRGTGDGVA